MSQSLLSLLEDLQSAARRGAHESGDAASVELFDDIVGELNGAIRQVKKLDELHTAMGVIVS